MSSRVPRMNPMATRRGVTDKVFTGSASERGQVMILICVGIFALMGMIAVVADFCFLQHQKNMMQTAADSAAMAGAEELNYGDQVAAGKADAASNGYTDGTGSVTVVINNPPSSGPNTSNTGYVEAIVSKPEPTYFLSLIGINTMTVSVRAVAYEGSGPNCIYVMDPTASSALSGSGSASIQSGCGVMVDSNSSSAIVLSGSASVTAPAIGVVGGYTGGSSASFTPTPKTGVIAAADPLAYVQAPTVGSCAHTNFSVSNGGSSSSYYQLYPGTYCGGITVSNGFLQFNAGTYVLAGGGLTSKGGPVMNGSAVTFYNTTGTGGYQAISLTGGATSNFSAPTSGPLAGILFFQDRAIPNSAAGSTVSGNSTSTFDGALYFPTTTLTFSGNSSLNGYNIVVANKVALSGNSTIGTNYSSLQGGSPIRGTVLAE
jgi:Putative Flp pilus-assembly TadE/G-like